MLHPIQWLLALLAWAGAGCTPSSTNAKTEQIARPAPPLCSTAAEDERWNWQDASADEQVDAFVMLEDMVAAGGPHIQQEIARCRSLLSRDDISKRTTARFQFDTDSEGRVTAVCMDPATTIETPDALNCFAAIIVKWRFSNPRLTKRRNVANFVPAEKCAPDSN